VKERKDMIDRTGNQLSIRRQCQLLVVNRNRLDPPPAGPRDEDLEACRRIDEIHLRAPAFGARKIRDLLRLEHDIRMSRGKVSRLMKLMGIEAIYRRPRTSLPGKGDEHKVYPYLLGERDITAPDEAWCTDITYIPMGRSFAYLVAVMDWHSRAVLSWKLSNTLDVGFCLDAFREAVDVAGKAPTIFNTDQGCQFTSRSWRELLESHDVRLSTDGKGRWVDNVFIERLWRSVKYEEVYLRDYDDLHELDRALGEWFESYNRWRPHDSLGSARPWEIYRPADNQKAAA
jgi:putative transposase